MKRILYALLISLLSCKLAFATQIVYPTTYGPTSQVTNVTLNGNNNAISNVVNGNLDNTNANTVSGYRFYQTVSSLPAAGNTGQVYYLTSDNSLNFDTGSTFIKTIAISGIPLQGNVVIYGASGLVYAATGTAGQPLISNGAGANPAFGIPTPSALGSGTPTSANVLLGSGAWGQNPYIKISNTQTQNTNGGAITQNAWTTVAMNTKDVDTASIGTLTSNQITIPAGTYQVKAFQDSYGTSGYTFQTRLFNVTASSVIITGEGVTSSNTTNSGMTSYLSGQFTVAGTTTISLQANTSTGNSTGNLGLACNLGPEVYANLELWKVN